MAQQSQDIGAGSASHLFSLDVVAWRLRESPAKVQELIDAGLLTVTRRGSQRFVDERELERFLDTLTIEIVDGRAVRVAKSS